MIKIEFVSLAILFLAGCEEKEITAPIASDQIEFVKLSTDDSSCKLKADPTKVSGAFIIKSKEEYEEHYTCSLMPSAVNLDNYFLLAGYSTINSCAKLKDQQVEATDGKLIYHVQIRQLLCSSIDTVRYSVLIPRTYSSKQIEFDINTVQ